MIRIIISILLFLGLSSIVLAEDSGTVCLEENLSIVASEHTELLYITIGDSNKIYFKWPYKNPRIVLNNLEINKDYIVKVYYDNKLVTSWKLNFKEIGTNSVVIWRAKASWRMEPIDVSLCSENDT